MGRIISVGQGVGGYKLNIVSLWLDQIQVRPSPRHLSGIFSLLLHHGGAFAKEGQLGGGIILSKTTPSFRL